MDPSAATIASRRIVFPPVGLVFDAHDTSNHWAANPPPFWWTRRDVRPLVAFGAKRAMPRPHVGISTGRERPDKSIDHPNRIVLIDPVRQALRKQRALL